MGVPAFIHDTLSSQRLHSWPGVTPTKLEHEY